MKAKDRTTSGINQEALSNNIAIAIGGLVLQSSSDGDTGTLIGVLGILALIGVFLILKNTENEYLFPPGSFGDSPEEIDYRTGQILREINHKGCGPEVEQFVRKYSSQCDLERFHTELRPWKPRASEGTNPLEDASVPRTILTKRDVPLQVLKDRLTQYGIHVTLDELGYVYLQALQNLEWKSYKPKLREIGPSKTLWAYALVCMDVYTALEGPAMDMFLRSIHEDEIQGREDEERLQEIVLSAQEARSAGVV